MYKIQSYEMKPGEIPECWLGAETANRAITEWDLDLTPFDIALHLIDELMDEEIAVDE
jgi:hypothetical protein